MTNTTPALQLHPSLSSADEQRIEDLLSEMSLAEKIGQMTQVEKNSITPEQVTTYRIGSVLSGGGGNPSPNTPASWAAMVRAFEQAALETPLAIPLLYGVDAVHGHNNVYSATIFPHNIGLGAAADEDLVRRIAAATAVELRATNVNWNFAPMVAVPQDLRWGRTYEGFGEDPDLVTRLGLAYAQGLTSGPHRVLESFKHYAADGGTLWGSSSTLEWQQRERPEIDKSYCIDQGDAVIDEATLRQIHLAPYVAAVEAGTMNIMVSFSSWNGLKMHAHHYLLTEVLKTELGFAGFLVSDWMAIKQLNNDNYTCIVQALNAGLDMIMVPFEFREFITDATRAVESGAVPIERIDDAVRRILRVKLMLGLFDAPFGDEGLLAQVGGDEHRALAREAVSRSAVLLKNEQDTLPLPPAPSTILVAGQAADDVGLQCGGWTVEWQGEAGNITPGTSLLEALRADLPASTEMHYQPGADLPAEKPHAEIGLVVISEPPYAEGMGDADDLTISDADRTLIRAVRQHCDRLVLVVYSGRPIILTGDLDLCDAVVAAWLPGTEGAGLADLLLGATPFGATLPFTWPRCMDQVPWNTRNNRTKTPLFPRGFGLTT